MGVPGKPEQRCKWDTLEPHQVARGQGMIRNIELEFVLNSFLQGLVHQNKFVRNKDPLYILHEDKVVFTRIVKT